MKNKDEMKECKEGSLSSTESSIMSKLSTSSLSSTSTNNPHQFIKAGLHPEVHNDTKSIYIILDLMTLS